MNMVCQKESGKFHGIVLRDDGQDPIICSNEAPGVEIRCKGRRVGSGKGHDSALSLGNERIKTPAWAFFQFFRYCGQIELKIRCGRLAELHRWLRWFGNLSLIMTGGSLDWPLGLDFLSTDSAEASPHYRIFSSPSVVTSAQREITSAPLYFLYPHCTSFQGLNGHTLSLCQCPQGMSLTAHLSTGWCYWCWQVFNINRPAPFYQWGIILSFQFECSLPTKLDTGCQVVRTLLHLEAKTGLVKAVVTVQHLHQRLNIQGRARAKASTSTEVFWSLSINSWSERTQTALTQEWRLLLLATWKTAQGNTCAGNTSSLEE